MKRKENRCCKWPCALLESIDINVITQFIIKDFFIVWIAYMLQILYDVVVSCFAHWFIGMFSFYYNVTSIVSSTSWFFFSVFVYIDSISNLKYTWIDD